MTSPVVCSIKHLSVEDRTTLKSALSTAKEQFPDDIVKANLYAADEVLSKLKAEEQSILKKAMELYKKSDAYNGKLHDETKANESSNSDSIDFKASEAFVEKLLAGESFKTIIQARKALTTQSIEAGTENAKKADEAIELAGVLAARKIVEQGMTESDTFDALVKLAEQMPSLNVRSSTSISEQAYSTPLPLAYVASIRAGINKSTTVTEPTAGNGALLIAASPSHVVANELNKNRLESLQEQGFDALNKNAVDFNFGNKDSDVVIANPPFGVVKDDNGVSATYKVNDKYSTNEIDHAIALNSLKSMRDDGKAVLIVGGPSKTLSEAARSDAYNGKAKRAFYKTVYDEYNVTDHFTVSGNLYAKQGAAWPVDVIVIDGRGKSSLRLPAADLPRIINTVSELKDELTANRKSVPEDTQSTEQGERTGSTGSDEGSGKNTDGKRNSGTDKNNGTSGVLPGLGDKPKGNGQESTSNADGQHDQGSKGTNGANTGADLTHDDLSNMFDDIIAEELDKRKPKEEVKQDRGIGELSSSVVKNSAQGLSDAINGLGALFGGNGRLSSGLSFDEETYAKAKPLFMSAIEHMGNAAADIKEAMRAIVKMVMDQFGADAVNNMKQYVVKFINDIQSGAESLTEKSKSATEAVNKFQAEYKPSSAVPSVGTLVPVNMQNSIEGALESLREKHGDVDSYVAKLLDYDKKDIAKYFSAEQVDAIGLALDNITNGKGFIIGDQTGVGKGRVNAAMIRYAILNKMTPIFVTEKPNLYGDMIRDLNDIGMPDIKPFATNAGFSIPIDEEAQNWYAANEKAKEEGEPSPPRYGKFIKTDAAAKHTKAMNDMVSNGDIGKNDVIFTTYSQMQTVKGARTPRMDFLEELAKGGLLILDESHNAGGVATVKRGGGEEEKGGRAAVVRRIVNNAKGVFYSSATYAKRPDVLDLYSKTDMGLIADPKTLIEALQAGGVPLQQAVASMLAKAGQYIRREKSFDGIAYDTTEAEVDREFAENAAEMMRDIMTFDEMKSGAVARIKRELKAEAKLITPNGSTGQAGAESANFTSSMHNMISQMLLMLKVQPTIDETIAALKRGEKPVIALSNTMGAAIDEYVKEAGLLPGDAINLSFGDLLKRYLKKSRMVTETDAYGNKEKRELTDEELGIAATRYYNKLLSKIDNTGFDKYPISPIDAIHDALAKAGYKSGEITGRSSTIDYSGDAPVYKKRPSQQISPAGKRKTINDFNNGLMDVIILNQSGATGLSLHSSPKVGGDTRKRHMIIAQPELNIDTHMQMLGRVNRTGQLVLPSYSQLVANIPAEKRPSAILAKKMAMLNAQTTAGKDSAVKAKDVPDFMNDYGDIVAAAIMNENRDVHRKIGRPLSESMTTGLETEGAMRKVTGRIPVLPLKEQEQLYTIIEEAYNEYIDMLTKTGQNQLEAEAMALDAKTIASNTVVPPIGASNSPFAEGVNAETVDVKRLGKPFTLDQIKGLLAKVGITDSTSKYDFINNIKDKLKSAKEARLNEIDAMPEEDESDIARKTSHKTTLESQLKEIEYFINRYPPGSPVTLTSPQGVEYLGYVGNFERKGDAKNYFANGQWKATIFVADAAKQFVLPLTQISTSVDRDGTWKIDSASQADVKEALEEGQSTSREQRTILTGNMLAAYGFNKTGQIINYTNDSSEVKQGVLMPKKFDLQTAIDAKPIIFASPDMAMEYLSLSDNPSYAIRSSDNSVRLIPQWNSSYKLYVPAPKSKGGMYYQNKRLVELLGDFYKTGKEMQVSIPKANLEEALRIIYPISKAMQPVSKETGKKFLDDKGIKFSKKAVDEHNSPLAFTREAITLFASEHPEINQTPIIDKSVKDLKAIAKGIDPGYTIDDYVENKGASGNDPVKQWHIWTPVEDGHKAGFATINQLKNGNVYLDVSMLSPGEGGSLLYALAGNFARNNNVKFIGDPRDLSKAAIVRRTENMLSLAIKFRSTEFLEPHASQGIEWKDNDNAGNFERLIDKSQDNLINGNFDAGFLGVPELKSITYNFETNQFEDRHGNKISQADFKERAKLANDRIRAYFVRNFPDAIERNGEEPAYVGSATLKRAAWIASLVRSKSENQSVILGNIVRQQGKYIDDLAGSLYSKTHGEAANNTESTIDQVTKMLPSRVKNLLESGVLRIVKSASDIQETAASQDAGNAEGFYDLYNDRITLIADNINSSNINSVLSHELLHRAEHLDNKISSAMDKFEADLQSRFELAAKGLGSKIEVAAAKLVIQSSTHKREQLSEFRAYMVSEWMKKPDSISKHISKAINDFISAIRSFLIRNGIDMGFIKSLSPSDLFAMSKYGAKAKGIAGNIEKDNSGEELTSLRRTIEAYNSFIKCLSS